MNSMSEQELDINKLKQLAHSPEGMQLVALFLQQNSIFSTKQLSNSSHQDMALLMEKANSFLASKEAQTLLKKLEETYV